MGKHKFSKKTGAFSEIINAGVESHEPLVSIIIPAKDPGRLLHQTLDSVLKQAGVWLEIILVDDGSKEQLRPFLSGLKTSFRLAYLRHSKSMGLSTARNAGLNFSRGEYVIFLDSDDFLLPGKVSVQAGILSGDKTLTAVCSRWKYLYEDGSLSVADGFYSSGKELRWRIFEGNIAPIHAFCFQSETLKKIGGFDAALSACEDWDLLARLIWGGAKFYFHPEVAGVYRRRSGSLSSDAGRMYTNGLKTLLKMRSLAGNTSEVEKAFETGFIKLQIAACRRLLNTGNISGAKKYFLKAVKHVWSRKSTAMPQKFFFKEVCRSSLNDIKSKSRSQKTFSASEVKSIVRSWLTQGLTGNSPAISILSPHCDDAPLSLGACFLAGRLGRDPEVVNVFTRSKYTLKQPCNGSVAAVTSIRKKEELTSARHFGYKAVFGGFGEPFARKGFKSMEDIRDISRDPRRDPCWPKTSRALNKLMADKNRAWMLPLGIGGHIDHRITRLAAICAATAAKSHVIGFYEDLPYAASCSEGEIRVLADSVKEFSVLKPVVFKGLLKEKLEALKIYSSQLGFKELGRVVGYWKRIGGERLWLTPYGGKVLGCFKDSYTHKDPSRIFFDVTYRCNAHCGFCCVNVNSLPQKHPKELSTADIKKIVDQFHSRKKISIGGGEPLLRGDIAEIISHIKKCGHECLLMTNGLLLTRKLLEKLLASGLDKLAFSIHGPAEVHEAVLEKKGFYARLMKIIRAVASARKKTKTKLYLWCTINKHNYYRLGSIAKALAKLKPDRIHFNHMEYVSDRSAAETSKVWRKSFNRHSNVCSSQREVEIIQMEKLISEIEKVKSLKLKNVFFYPKMTMREACAWYDPDKSIWRNRVCRGQWENMTIAPDGRIISCQILDEKLGDIKNRSYLREYYGPAFNLFRKTLENNGGLFPACNKCGNVWNRCGL